MAAAGEFPKVSGDIIYALDFDIVYNQVVNVLGPGLGTTGYGATLLSSTVSAASAPTGTITDTQWDNLRSDILNIRKHQLGAGASYNAVVSSLTDVNESTTVSTSIINALKTEADTGLANADTVASTQLTKVTGVSSTQTASWQCVVHSVTVSFATADNARNFFNAGGYLTYELSYDAGSISAGASTSKNQEWADLLDAQSQINFTRTNYRSGSANVQIRSRRAVSSPYGDSYIQAWGHKLSSTSIRITVRYDDASGQPNPPFGTDEPVTLNVTGSLNYYKSIDAVVSPTPAATNTWTNSGFSDAASDVVDGPAAPDPTYDYDPEWLDEYAATYGYTTSAQRSSFLSRGQNLANGLYLPNTNFGVIDGVQRYGLYRKPDAAGLAFWTDYALDTSQTASSTVLRQSFFGGLSGSDDTRSRTASKSFDAGSGDGDFYDRSA